jgi:hypothetical protein
MPRWRLLRRREVWVPTFAGSALAALVCALALLGLTRGIYPYLAQHAPVGHGLLVVEGWLPAGAIAHAVGVFRSGAYERFVVTGGPIEDEVCPPGYSTWAERAGGLARHFGIHDEELAVVPAPTTVQDRTFRSAVSVRQWAEASGRPVAALDVYSLGPHARRSRWLYQLAFGDEVAVGVLAASPRYYGPESWLRTSEGARSVLSELVGLAWVRLVFDPGPRGSAQEQWGPPLEPPGAAPQAPAGS